MLCYAKNVTNELQSFAEHMSLRVQGCTISRGGLLYRWGDEPGMELQKGNFSVEIVHDQLVSAEKHVGLRVYNGI